MSSPDESAADLGLLAPIWAGSQVEAATGDAAVLRAMLAAEAALARAQAALGLVPDEAAAIIQEAAGVIREPGRPYERPSHAGSRHSVQAHAEAGQAGPRDGGPIEDEVRNARGIDAETDRGTLPGTGPDPAAQATLPGSGPDRAGQPTLLGSGPDPAEQPESGAWDARDLALRARAGGNPVIPLVADLTAAVSRRSPAAAPYVHLGATSQDILDTALMSVAGAARSLILADLDRAASALARLADEHRGSVMAGRTLTQHAVPTTFGLKAAGWRDLVLDARDRLHGVRLPAQLGGAAGTLAALHAYAASAASGPLGPRGDTSAGERKTDDIGPCDQKPDGISACERETSDLSPRDERANAAGVQKPDVDDLGVRLLRLFARETSLAEPVIPWHVLRTPVADLGTALALAVAALGKIAADVLVLSRTEIGELAEGEGGGSSAMPHKSNPVRATLIASAARQAPPLAAVLMGSTAAEDERPPGAWHAEWQPLRELLRLAGGAAASGADLVAGLRVDSGRMRANLDLTRGLIAAERLSALLAPLMGRKEARALVERASHRAASEGVNLEDALRDKPVPLATEELHALLDPAAYTGSADALIDRALRRTPRSEGKASGPQGSRPHETGRLESGRLQSESRASGSATTGPPTTGPKE